MHPLLSRCLLIVTLAPVFALEALALDSAGSLRFVNYNTWNNPDDELEDQYFETVMQSIASWQQDGGIASRAPDLIALAETDTNSSIRLADVMNSLFPDAFYLVEVSASDGSYDRTGFLYNDDVLTLSDLDEVPGLSHPVLTGRFTTNTGEAFLAYAVHLHGGSPEPDQAIRADEAAILRQHATDAQQATGGLPIWMAGDFNINRSTEDAWWIFTQGGVAQVFDPLVADGDWKENPAYLQLHTKDSFGPMDVRFDFQLLSAHWFDGEGLEYIEGSYHAKGNNGSHNFAEAIDTGSAESSGVLAALMAASDHLPVVADYYVRLLPNISLSVIATPSHVSELGEDVQFSLAIYNHGSESVSIVSLSDSVFDLSGHCADAVGRTLTGGANYSCLFTERLSGSPDTAHENITTVSVTNSGGASATSVDNAIVAFDDLLPDVSIVKAANPTRVSELGSDVEFTLLVTNNGAETTIIDALTDSRFDLSIHCADASGTPLVGGATYTCLFTENLVGEPSVPHESAVLLVASDDDGNSVEASDNSTIVFEDVLPSIAISKTAFPEHLAELGGDVEFTLVATNTGGEMATIQSLSDSEFDLTSRCPDAVSTSLTSGSSYTCRFTEHLNGEPNTIHLNTATVMARDNDGNSDIASDNATVVFDDVPPDASIVVTADPILVSEVGDNVTFSLMVSNNSGESVTIDTLSADNFELSKHCPNAFGAVLTTGEHHTCQFTEYLIGKPSAPRQILATVQASDNDGNIDTASASTTITFGDLLPDVSIVKTANPTRISELGSDVEFTLLVTNNGAETTVIDALTDSSFDLSIHCADASGTSLVGGATYTCLFTENLVGEPSLPHESAVLLVASDDDGNSAEASDNSTVVFEDVLPSIAISKTVSPEHLAELGGDVEFTLVATNTGLEKVTVQLLSDSEFDLTSRCPDAAGTPLASGASYTCRFTEHLSGEPTTIHLNTSTIVARDNDGNSDIASDNATVIFDDVLPDASIVVTADPILVSELGDNVTFSLMVTNNAGESITIDTMSADNFELSKHCPNTFGANLASGEHHTCQFTEYLTGEPSAPREIIATVQASDNDGNIDTASASARITFGDLLPEVSITTTVNPTHISATGGNVQFDVVVMNNGTETITIESIANSDFDLMAGCSDAIGKSLASDEYYHCSFIMGMSGEPNIVVDNVVTVVAMDNDGNSASSSAHAALTFTGAQPICSTGSLIYSQSLPASSIASENSISLRDLTLTGGEYILQAPNIVLQPGIQLRGETSMIATAQRVSCSL